MKKMSTGSDTWVMFLGVMLFIGLLVINNKRQSYKTHQANFFVLAYDPTKNLIPVEIEMMSGRFIWEKFMNVKQKYF